MTGLELPFLTSAPGKVIIFGEHSVVYNKPAIAAALSLRTYLLVTENTDPSELQLEFPDIGFSHSWKIKDFPWHLVELNNGKHRPLPTDELVPEVIDELYNNMLTGFSTSRHYSAAVCFLYLYLNLCDASTKGLKFTVRSTLPIGAGLGSSASISVCLSSALSFIGGHVSRPDLALNDPTHGKENPDTQFIDAWSFMGEKCIHGTPSGIDNACASHGGAVMFQKNGNNNTGIANVRTSMRSFPSLDLLLTNTKISRNTADLVSGVSRLNQDYPAITTSILNSMEAVAREAYSIMLKPFDETSKLTLQKLVRINQGLLSSLGVSHPSLDKIKMLTDEMKVGATKLTGAGGGGCAVTLLNDEVDKNVLQELIGKFTDEGFETFETKLGGKGCGLLIMSNEQKQTLKPDTFIDLQTRSDIEKAVGCEYLSNWRFW